MMARPRVRPLMCSRHRVPMTAQRGRGLHQVKTCPVCVADARAKVRAALACFAASGAPGHRLSAPAASSPQV